MAELDPLARELLEGPNVVHLATALPDGAPHSVAVWARIEDRRIAFFTQESSRKARNLGRDPRVAVSLIDRDNPYRMAWVRGRVTATLHGDAALEVIDRLSNDYTGRDFPMRQGIVFLVEPERSGSLELPFIDTPPG